MYPLPLIRRLVISWAALLAGAAGWLRAAEPAAADYDVVVFGATSAGVTAAVAAGRAGARVVLIEPSYLPGGMMTGGLTKTDIGKSQTIGGLAREFFDRVLAYYSREYGVDSEQAKASAGGYFFEPKVGLRVFTEMLAEAKVTVRTRELLEDVQVEKGRVIAITTREARSGQVSRWVGRQFVDGSYEGDLLASAGVIYRVGREARSEFGESLAGQTEGPSEYLGKGDHRVQAYNIRGTLSVRDDNRVAIPKPKNYYREAHAGLIRTVNLHHLTTIEQLFPDHGRWAMINGKCDPNKGDFLGVNFGYAEGDYEQRARITAKVQDYWLSLWWMLQNDPELPEAFKANARRWGLPKDEYEESGHVTPQIYVRVARRLQGRYFLTQRDVQIDRTKPDTICMGSYNLDAHFIQIIQTDGGPKGEGHFNASADPYEIPYRCIVPYGVDNLLVVAAVSASHVAYSSLRMEPVFMMIGQAGGIAASLALKDAVATKDISIPKLQAALRADRVPLDAPFRPVVSIRVKTPNPAPGQPVEFEVVPQQVRGALKTLSWSFDGSGRVQASGASVQHVFRQPGVTQVMLWAQDADKLVAIPATAEVAVGAGASLDREVHYDRAQLSGRWTRTRGPEIEYRNRVALMDEGKGEAGSRAVFKTALARSGRYLVAVAFPSGGNRASNATLTITHAEGTAVVSLDQKKKPAPFAFQPVGEYRFDADRPATVTFSSAGANGRVLIDSVRWIWLGE